MPLEVAEKRNAAATQTAEQTKIMSLSERRHDSKLGAKASLQVHKATGHMNKNLVRHDEKV